MNFISMTPNIGVKDVNKTVEFYKEIFDFNLVLSNPNSGKLVWALVGRDNVYIMFQEENNLKSEFPQMKQQPLCGCLTFYVKMKNVKKLYERVKDTEYLIKEMHKTYYGETEFAVIDNNGHIFTIAED